MKRIVYTRQSDGGVSVVVPSPKFIAKFTDEDAAIADLLAHDVPSNAIDVKVVDETEVPSDREFRAAWKLNAGSIEVDIVKARAVQAARIEAARMKKMRKLLEREALGENVTGQKAALAAMNTNAAANAADVAALRRAWPAGLEKNP